ncbi:MAG: gliding motility lipoprotein GldD [Bacteroidales bacterium]
MIRFSMTRVLTLVLLLLVTVACYRSSTPKPKGYVRIDYPDKEYHLYTGQENYQFEIPVYSKVEPDTGPRAEPGWINVVIPPFNGTIHMSYKSVENNLDAYIADARTLVYKHTVRAESIEETPFFDRQERRYGIVYDLKGNVASAVQFFVTDSTRHFLRGSLYFNTQPNRDSLNPVIEFLHADILHMIETTQWKY